MFRIPYNAEVGINIAGVQTLFKGDYLENHGVADNEWMVSRWEKLAKLYLSIDEFFRRDMASVLDIIVFKKRLHPLLRYIRLLRVCVALLCGLRECMMG